MQQSQQLSTVHQFPSVTSVLGLLDKPALLYWAANEAAACAVDNLGMIRNRVEKEGRDEVIQWIADARKRPKKGHISATALGTIVHDLCEQYQLREEPFGSPWALLSKDVPPDATVMYERFVKWCEREQPTFEVAECTVVGGKPEGYLGSAFSYGLGDGYAGTLDAIWTWRGQRILVDFTTNRNAYDKDGRPTHPYAEKVLQLAAYRFADLLIPTRLRAKSQFSRRWYEITDEEIESAEKMPPVDACFIMHLTPSSARMFPVNADERAFEAFMALRSVYELWSLNQGELIGEPC